jgi:hypothetical protein
MTVKPSGLRPYIVNHVQEILYKVPPAAYICSAVKTTVRNLQLLLELEGFHPAMCQPSFHKSSVCTQPTYFAHSSRGSLRACPCTSYVTTKSCVRVAISFKTSRCLQMEATTNMCCIHVASMLAMIYNAQLFCTTCPRALQSRDGTLGCPRASVR